MEAVKTRTMSVCGVQCNACEHYPDICLGCKALEGKPYWLQYVEDRNVCDIYECCKKSKKLKHCGHCHELPCILYEAQDPTKSEEDNQKEFLMQMKNLTEAQ